MSNIEPMPDPTRAIPPPSNKNIRRLTLQNKNTFTHDNTAISKRVRTIEGNLKAKLDKIINEIRKDNLTNHNEVLLRHVYGVAVNDVIRSAVQRSYLEGIDHIAVDTHKIDGYISTNDLEVIKKLSASFVDQFWFLIGKYLIAGKQEQLVQRQPSRYTFVSTSPLSINSRITVLATTITHTTLSVATVQKAKELTQKQKIVFTAKTIPAKDMKIQKRMPPTDVTQTIPTVTPRPLLDSQEPISPGLVSPEDISQTGEGLTGIGSLLSLLGLSQDQQGQTSSQVTWQTAQDERVCPICAPLQGMVWDANDASIPMPGGEGDTHYNCRCRIMVLGSDNEVASGGGI